MEVRLFTVEGRGMANRIYRHLSGMDLEFRSGMVEENAGERAIRCSFTFDLRLPYTSFVKMANEYIPGYLDSAINAIRPELDGLAYHVSFNYFGGAAGNIGSNEALFRIFSRPDDYMSEWSSGELQKRYGKPEFEIFGGTMRMTARTDFRWEDPGRLIKIADLPIIRFQWALNLLEGHMLASDSPPSAESAPDTKVVVMYPKEDFVDVEGLQLFRGMHYVRGSALSFGPLTPEQILTAR